MVQDDVYIDRYEYYEEQFDPSWIGPHKGQHKPKANHRSRKSRSQIIVDLTDDLADVELTFGTTYQPSHHEQSWLLSSLHSFYDQGLITDVLSLVKGGKEASVYCCQAHPTTGLGLLAAKVYRPRMFRNLRNDKMYRQGREILTAGGNPAGRNLGYIERAIRNKTPFGQQAAHTSWLMHEFTAMEHLYSAGGDVPRPIAPSDNAILMSYHGDENMAAPTLNTVYLEPGEAEYLFQRVLRNVDLMLQHNLIHGDLSAYNILYWDGGITIIDFPQVVNLRANPEARLILQRDIRRICEYFAGQGVQCDPDAILGEIWARYVRDLTPEDQAADWSRLTEELELP